MKKVLLVFIMVIVFLVFNTCFNKDNVTSNSDNTPRAQRIASVLNAKFDELGLFNFQIIDSDTEPSILIEMDENKSEQKLREYLLENISTSDLSYYDIEISKKNLQKVQKEHSALLKESENRGLNIYFILD